MNIVWLRNHVMPLGIQITENKNERCNENKKWNSLL